MRKLLLAPLLLVAALAVPGYAAAGPCGTPDVTPLWVDFATPEIGNTFGKPGLVLAASSGGFPAEMRAKGAKTIYWDMYLRTRVGTPSAPADPAVIEERTQRLFDIAVRQTACPNPPIILNELFGSQLETPWSPSNEQYRANVLAFVRGVAARGAGPGSAAGGVLRRPPALEGRADPRQPAHADVIPKRRGPADLDRGSGLAGWPDARVFQQGQRRRPGGALGRKVAPHRQVAGSCRAPGRRRDEDRLRRFVGLGAVLPADARPHRRRQDCVRLPLGARPGCPPVRRPGGGR